MIDESIKNMLVRNAEHYENKEFLNGDPSWWMHQVSGKENQEAMAFVASVLSYGSRTQFMPKIGSLLEDSKGEFDKWIREGRFRERFHEGDKNCFYRLYNCDTMYGFLAAYQKLMNEYQTLGEYVRQNAKDGFEAVEAICGYFSKEGVSVVVPKDTTSACKRVCMFLRWMVRDNSPVDLRLWPFIDKRTLIMPMDTHVMQQSVKLGLLQSKVASMNAARRLTASLAEVFPDDPLKGDFALFGYGVNSASLRNQMVDRLSLNVISDCS